MPIPRQGPQHLPPSPRSLADGLLHKIAREHIWFNAAAMMFLTSQHSIQAPQSTGTTPIAASDEYCSSLHNAEYRFSTFNFICPILLHLPETYGSHIQLITVSCDPMEYIINNFRSSELLPCYVNFMTMLTCRLGIAGVINMLTLMHAISLFPRTTFINEEMFNCRDLSGYPGWNTPWMDKYRRRRFSVFVASDRLPKHPELVT